MAKLTEYKVVQASSIDSINTKVNELINNGWKPIGSHQVVAIDTVYQYRGSQLAGKKDILRYSQTMILKVNT